MKARALVLERRTLLLVIVVVLQLLATIIFIVDVVGDAREANPGAHVMVEAAAAMALLAGVLFGADQIRRLVLNARRDETAVATARGAMADLVRLRFDEWQLTAAEADVALFALKGCDIAEIAALRHTAAGTVRAQLTGVYAKAGVKSQVALIALFMEDLVDAVPAAAAQQSAD